jgi:hypothetical protein
MEATPLCLSLNKPHLFGLTQHGVTLIQLLHLHYESTCFGLHLGDPHACQNKNHTKKDKIKIQEIQGAPF